MAKNTKKGTTSQVKPITDFFTPASKSRVAPSVPSQASSSQNVSVTGASETTGVLVNKSKVVSVASKPSIESSSRVRGLECLGESESSSQYSTKTGLSKPSIATISSLKRVRSPDFQAHVRASTPFNGKKAQSNSVKPLDRRRGKFDSDSDVEMPNTIVYVSTPNPQSCKKARLSPAEVSSRVGSLVPSSQSDEEDLASMIEQTQRPTLTQESLELSADNNLISERTTKATPTNCHNTTPIFTSHLTGQMLTPPLTDPSFSAPTPFPLDPATKTAQIIAQIKQRAYAKTQSSPEVAPLEFNDDLDDSSDDDSFLPVLPFVTKPVSSTGNTLLAAAAFEDTSIELNSHYFLRSRSPMLPSSNSSPSSRISRGSLPRRCPSPPKVVKNHTGKGKKTVAYNPFDALLKEKKLAEKSGKGHDAFHRAETTTGKFGEDSLLDVMDEEDDWSDQNVAATAVRGRDWPINRPMTPDSSKANNDDLRLGDVDRRKLFGEDGGKAIMGILEHDKIAKREVLNRQVPGSGLWSLPGVAHGTAMVIDETPFIAEISAASPLICLLKKSIQCGDLSRAALILNMDILSTVKPTEQSAIVQYLCELVLSAQRTSLSEPASRALESHWNSKTTTCGLSFSQVLAAVQRLGANVTVLSSQKWPITLSYVEDVTTEVREDFIRRLMILVNIGARKFWTAEAPDLVLLLLLIGTDISTSPDLQLDIIQCINLICNSIASKDMGFEAALCSKVLNCISSYEPMNKARIIASLSAGTGSTKRIASFIAYCVIVDRTTAAVEISDLPPLNDILEQFRPSASLGSSKFLLSETTNYLDLGYYISILAIALSNVRGYVTGERRASKTKQSTSSPLSPHKRTERLSDLQLVYTALETLHSNISDSKALHLERSRTKAILKGLSMYIHYQRDYWLKHDHGPQSKKLVHYFKKAP